MTTRSTQKLLKSYPITIDGKLTHVKPHDCRRTYARRQYDAGLSVEAIQQNLGHASRQTTLGYIGQLDAEQREAKGIYSFDLSTLDSAPAPERAHGGWGGGSEVARNAHAALNDFMAEIGAL